MTLPGVSIVMTPRDRRRQLDATLETIFAQNYPDLEIIIVEDRPTEASLEAYCKRYGIKYDARRSRIEGWMNPAPLMNRGLLMSVDRPDQIIIFQNGECKYETLTGIADLVMPIAQARLDHEPPLSTCACVQSLNRDGSFEMWYTHPKIGHRAGWISPFCQAIPRASLMKIQGVEEAFCKGGYGLEDDYLEFCLRYSGVQLKYVESVLVSHQWHSRFQGDQNNGNPDIYKQLRREVEIGERPPIANWNKPWGNL